MNHHIKSKEELIKELEELKQAHDALKISYEEGVNERKLFEGAIMESQSQHRLLDLDSSDVTWILDRDHNFIFVSPSVYQLRGLTPEEVMLESIHDSMTPRSQELFLEALLTCKDDDRIKNRLPVRIELEQYHKEGRLVLVEVFIRALLNNQRETIGYVGSSRDLARRKRPEKAIAQVVARFETLVAKVPVGIYILGLREGGKVGFEYVSDRWCEIHQVSREEVMADISNINDKIHKDDIGRLESLTDDAVRNGARFVWEGRFNIAGEQRWFRIESIPVPFDSGESQWYGVAQDITERKQAESALRESEIELRELNSQKDKFFSIIAHDLMSPFNAILGFSELLMTEIKEGDFSNVYEYAEIIQQSSKKSVDLLTDLLGWSRAQTGRMEFNPIHFELVDLIAEHKVLFDAIAGKKSIALFDDLTGEMMVYADKHMISTVLRNLISNAIKFTRKGGRVAISAVRRAEEIIVSVSDSGIGIKPERLEKLFRIDESESTSGTNNETGTGLGLILCQEFVGKHGGKLWVESELGKGSVFSFSLSCGAK